MDWMSISLILLVLSPLVGLAIREAYLCWKLKRSNRRKLQEFQELIEKTKQ